MSTLSKIVLAWTAPDFEVVRERRRDLGERPEMRELVVGKAAMWKNSVSAKKLDAEVTKATAYARQQEEHDRPIHVFVYPGSERDPLNRAKQEVLSGVNLPPGTRAG